MALALRVRSSQLLKRVFLRNSRSLSTGIRHNEALRTHTCGELQAEHAGQEVTLCGWILARRYEKFIVLKDCYGSVQILLDHCDSKTTKYVVSLPLESVIQVKGIVQERPKGKVNKDMATGEMEVNMREVKLLGVSSPNIPFTAKDLDKVGDVPKLKYRYLYLRKQEMQENLKTRSDVVQSMSRYLHHEKGFIYVKTPNLCSQSPGGAKEFLVFSEIPGKFYALSQSPQLFKQMLMISQFDKYFQVADCYRKEGTKSDRQPEFTQVDIEAAFVTAEDIKCLIEGLLQYSWPKYKPELRIPFPRITYKDAMHQYGSDKPDLRYNMKLQYLTQVLTGKGITIFDQVISTKNGIVAAIVVPSGSSFISKSQLQELKKRAELFSQNILDIQIKKDLTWNSVLAKHLSADLLHEVNSILNVKPQDLVLLSAGKYDSVVPLLGRMRVYCAEYLVSAGVKLWKHNDFKFLWVEDFPLFQQKEDGCLESVHHPFTAPCLSDVDLVYTNPVEAIGQNYDLVLNGQEIGGGSIRINDPGLQQYVLEKVLKVDMKSFQYFLEALRYGCPPHGGIALGIDRLVAIICGCRSISEVIAFPKSLDGKDPLTEAPALLSVEDHKICVTHLTHSDDINE